MSRRFACGLASGFVAVLALSACGAKETGPESESGDTHAPEIASPMPAATSEPQFARFLLSFDGFDSDADGFISNPEYAAGWSKAFQAMDSDEDGVVTLEEMDAARGAMGSLNRLSSEKLIGLADQDNNSELTLAEYVAASNSNFEQADVNADRRLDPEEWRAGGLSTDTAPSPSQD